MENSIEGFIERIQGFFMKLMSAGLAWVLQLSVTGIHWQTHKGWRHNWSWVFWRGWGGGGWNPKYTKTLKAASAFLIFDFKEAVDVMKDIERQAYFRTGRRWSQGHDTFKTLHSSFEKTKSFFSEKKIAVYCTGHLLSKFHDTTCGTFPCGS